MSGDHPPISPELREYMTHDVWLRYRMLMTRMGNFRFPGSTKRDSVMKVAELQDALSPEELRWVKSVDYRQRGLVFLRMLLFGGADV